MNHKKLYYSTLIITLVYGECSSVIITITYICMNFRDIRQSHESLYHSSQCSTCHEMLYCGRCILIQNGQFSLLHYFERQVSWVSHCHLRYLAKLYIDVQLIYQVLYLRGPSSGFIPCLPWSSHWHSAFPLKTLITLHPSTFHTIALYVF